MVLNMELNDRLSTLEVAPFAYRKWNTFPFIKIYLEGLCNWKMESSVHFGVSLSTTKFVSVFAVSSSFLISIPFHCRVKFLAYCHYFMLLKIVTCNLFRVRYRHSLKFLSWTLKVCDLWPWRNGNFRTFYGKFWPVHRWGLLLLKQSHSLYWIFTRTLIQYYPFYNKLITLKVILNQNATFLHQIYWIHFLEI